jgi:hypothetical protein
MHIYIEIKLHKTTMRKISNQIVTILLFGHQIAAQFCEFRDRKVLFFTYIFTYIVRLIE